MKRRLSFLVALLFSAGMPGCGGVLDPLTGLTGIIVTPGPTTARVGNGVTFSVLGIYSDGHTAPLDSDITWTHDSRSWVTWSGSTAQCVAASPVFFGVPETAQITATTTINGNTYSDHSGIECVF